jgi:threonine/homoserine/homoserine lactone efflux protein
MEALITFFIAFVFSFIGTFPPGTLNLSIVQLGLELRFSVAWRFAFAAGMIEYFYAWLAVECEELITSSPMVIENFQLITSIVMLSLGLVNLRSSKIPSKLVQRFNNSGFRRGVLLAILNPLALPFWVAMTAYIKNQHWADLSDSVALHSYLLGVALGGFSVMILLAYVAGKAGARFQANSFLKRLPGFTLLLLGAYALVRYLI